MRGLVIRYPKALLVGCLAVLACQNTKLQGVVSQTSQIDTFSQTTRAQSDILWIVDDSGSMAREQDQLAASFPKFFAHLQAAEVDYPPALTPRDIFPQGGDLVGNPAIIVGNSQDPRVVNTPDPQTAFGNNIHVGTQ